jgi:hypothetical protein
MLLSILLDFLRCLTDPISARGCCADDLESRVEKHGDIWASLGL